MNAIKTPVSVRRNTIIGADGYFVLGCYSEAEAKEVATTLNACAGLTVEAMEQRVVERAIALLRGFAAHTHPWNDVEYAAVIALIDAAPNSEAVDG